MRVAACGLSSDWLVVTVVFQESQQSASWFQPVWGPVFRGRDQVKATPSDYYVYPSRRSWDSVLLLSYCFLPDFPLFLHPLTSLTIMNYEACSRASIVARLRSQNGLGQKWLLLCQESHVWFSFSGDPLP